MKNSVKVPRTRRLVPTRPQLRDLLVGLYVPESVPNKITSFYVHKEKLVVLGTLHNKPVRLETHRSLLTASARTQGLLSPSEDVIEFAREGDNIVLLVTATDIEGNPLEYTRGPIQIHKADVKAYLKNLEPPSNLTTSSTSTSITTPNRKSHLMWTVYVIVVLIIIITLFVYISLI